MTLFIFLDIAPAYYKEKNLDAENWFVISDIRRIVHNDFEQVRDTILGNFVTPNFGNHHYAIYGNKYVYPLVIDMDNPIDYFETDNESFRFFTEIYKSEKSLQTKKSLMAYCFGDDEFYSLHPNTQDAVVSAEIEYQENKEDPLYDFSSIVIKLSKAFEKEIYLFMKELFIKLIELDSSLAEVKYSVQSKDYKLKDHKNSKPNIGTNNFLLNKYEIKNAIRQHISNVKLKDYIIKSISKAIYSVQGIRNETVHGEAASFNECKQVRDKMIGIGESGILSEMIKHKKILNNKKEN